MIYSRKDDTRSCIAVVDWYGCLTIESQENLLLHRNTPGVESFTGYGSLGPMLHQYSSRLDYRTFLSTPIRKKTLS